VPKLGQLASAAEVLSAHQTHGRSFRPLDLAAAWNALGKHSRKPRERQWLGREAGEGLAALAEQTLQMMPRFPARAVANTVHGAGSVESRVRWRAGGALWDAAAARGEQTVGEFKPQELANTAWAYATAGHAAPALLDALAAEAAGRVREFNPQELANTAWAYATAGHAAPALLDALAAEAAGRVREFNPQELANTAWAFAVADRPAPVLFGGDTFVQRCAAERGFVLEHLRQLHQWQLWQEERGAAWPPLTPELAQRCRAAFCEEEGVPSQLQRDVAATLRALELAPREEVRTPQGYSLDAVVSHGGREVAVEVDGPTHFVGRTPTSVTALKRRQLRAAGWALLPVPYWEWNALGSQAAKQEYLKRALEGLGEP